MGHPLPVVYHGYRTNVRSEVELRWPRSEPNATPDIELQISDQKHPRASLDLARATPVMSLPGLGAFALFGDRRLALTPEAGHPDRLKLLATLGLAAVFHRRGRVVLHGAAVEWNGVTAGFVGPTGAGKSTLVAHLQRQGARFLSDGLIVLEWHRSQPMVVPGPRVALLWPDVLKDLGHDPAALERVIPSVEKRRLPVEGAEPELSRLQVLFVLAEPSAPLVRPIRAAEQLFGVARNMYLHDFVAPNTAGDLLRQAARVAACVSASELARAKTLGAMNTTAEQVRQSIGA